MKTFNSVRVGDKLICVNTEGWGNSFIQDKIYTVYAMELRSGYQYILWLYDQEGETYLLCSYPEDFEIIKSGNEMETNNSYIIDKQKLKEQMVESFYKAIREASGNPESIVTEDLTFGEMLDGLSQNGIRFYYDPKGVLSKQ